MRKFLYWPAMMLALPAHATSLAHQSPMESAATQPLRDVRIRDEEIPEVLRMAASAPYSTQGTNNCRFIAAEVARLDGALGADADAPGSEEPGRGAEIAAAATRAAIGSLIPGLGLLRVVTGADRHQARVEAAVQAGMMRRSFLKGIGAHQGCSPPAAPTRAAREAVQVVEIREEE